MILRYYPEKWIINGYKKHSLRFGDVVSYLYMGECIGFNWLFSCWNRYEKEYSRRGYRTISIDELIMAGGYGKDISKLYAVKRDAGEEVVLHSEIYRDEYLGQFPPILDLTAQGPQYLRYTLPSTEYAKNEEDR